MFNSPKRLNNSKFKQNMNQLYFNIEVFKWLIEHTCTKTTCEKCKSKSNDIDCSFSTLQKRIFELIDKKLLKKEENNFKDWN